MPLSIKDNEADRLAREITRLTGESITEAVKVSLRERLVHLEAAKPSGQLADQLDDIALAIAALPVLDERSPEALIGYDEEGLPG